MIHLTRVLENLQSIPKQKQPPICYLGCMSVLQADGTSWDFCDTPIHW